MIYLKRILTIILTLILIFVFVFSLIITILLYPFYTMIYYVINGELGENLDNIVKKMIDIIFKPLNLLE